MARNWPGVADEDDVEQEILVRLLESPGSTRKIASSSREGRYRMVTRMGHQIAAKERDDHDHFTGNYHYSVDEARELLRSGALSTGQTEFSPDVVDLRQALSELGRKNAKYADAILERYLDGRTGTGDVEFRNLLSRAHEALANLMNRFRRSLGVERSDHGGPGSRRAVRHGEALGIQERQW
ncbi:hypothetical protein [Segniliparus rugosus]|uniref:hypothetical protein n=1 Tax=Segniliparus rugosus TaxID=286804 RepID=UPI0002FAD191|nr:hypothetical protein [Segniliparus rugosus]